MTQNNKLFGKSGKKGLIKRLKLKKQTGLIRSRHNPILASDEENDWESGQTFNPAVLFVDEKVHILYRALGEDGISRLGYAISEDGVYMDDRSKEPIYSFQPVADCALDVALYYRIFYSSGGGYGGCEDPRLTRIGDRIYLIFTGFDGWSSVRVALTSISLEDFLERRWNWNPPALISSPGEIHKNWVLFPEKINGKYAILHSISPKISIAYLDDLDFSGEKYINSYYSSSDSETTRRWNSRVRGAGPSTN